MRRSMWVLVSGALFMLATQKAAQWVDERAAREWGVVAEGLALSHAIAMTAAFALTVTAATLLLRAGWRASAAFTVIGAVLGPMSLLSPPVSSASGELGSASPSTTGRIAVGLLVGAWMLGTAYYVKGEGRSQRLTHELASYGVPLTVVMTGYFTVPDALTDPGHGDIGLGLVLGWAMVTSGVVAAGLAAARLEGPRAVTVAAYLLPVLALGVVGGMYGAYNATGGWPAVAGWTFAQPPIYATVVTAAFLVLAGLAAALVRPVAGVVRRSAARVDLVVEESQPISA